MWFVTGTSRGPARLGAVSSEHVRGTEGAAGALTVGNVTESSTVLM
ncbi:MAG: hypothetical protein U0470_05930 [Anaerolineae bacterium]